MTLLEVIKKAEEKQKILGENIKVYIRRPNWNNKLVDPTDFTLVNVSSELGEPRCTFNKTPTEFCPNKYDMNSNSWELFIHCLNLKENKEAKPESTSITKENVTNAINQIALTKKKLNELLEDTTKIKAMFEKNYGINFDYFVKNPKILIDSEDAVLYFFAELVTATIKEINVYLHEAIVEFDKTDLNKKENNQSE